MSLETCIEKIIDDFKSGDYFDSHAIINELIANKEYHLEYLREFPNDCTDIAIYHREIANKIKKLKNVDPIADNCKSHTIYGELSPNTLWKKK